MFRNLTPHEINIVCASGAVVTVPKSGQVARLSTTSVVVDTTPEGVEIFQTVFGEIVDLPEPQEGVLLIVSGLVATRVKRDDIFSPGELLRDEGGQPVGCRGIKKS